jgi:hypothetical protein
VWLDDTKTLHHYVTLLRHTESVVLSLRVRPRAYLGTCQVVCDI